MRTIPFYLLALLVAGTVNTQAGTLVRLDTSAGLMVVELEDDKAPVSSRNFLSYVRDGYYDGTIFHRVLRDFVVQGGGFTDDMRKKPGLHPPIANEADNGLSNTQGTLAMARTSAPDSATSQFYINVADNSAKLDHTEKTPRGWGYAVFGKVVAGWDTVEKIRRAPTTFKAGFRDVPSEAIVLEKAAEITPEQFDDIKKSIREQ